MLKASSVDRYLEEVAGHRHGEVATETSVLAAGSDIKPTIELHHTEVGADGYLIELPTVVLQVEVFDVDLGVDGEACAGIEHAVDNRQRSLEVEAHRMGRHIAAELIVVELKLERAQFLLDRRQRPLSGAEVAILAHLHLLPLVELDLRIRGHKGRLTIFLHLRYRRLPCLAALGLIGEVGNAHAYEVDVGQLGRDLLLAVDAEHTTEAELHMSLGLSIVLILGLEQEVGLRLGYLGLGEEEVEGQLVGSRLHLEHIGVAVLILAALERPLVVDVAPVVDVLLVLVLASEQWHTNATAEVAAIERVLHNIELHLLDGESPTADLTCHGVEDVVQVGLQRSTALVEEHVVHACLQALLLIGASKREGLREADAYLLDIKSLPRLDLVGGEHLRPIVGLGERSHSACVGRGRVVVDHFAGHEGPTGQVVGLKRVHLNAGLPVAPIAHTKLDVHLRKFGGDIACVGNLLELGDGHLYVDHEGRERVGAPTDVATVLGRLAVVGDGDVARRLKRELKLRVLLGQRKVGEQADGSALWQQAVGTDAKMRRTQHKHLVLDMAALGHHERAHEVHRRPCGGERYVDDLQIDRHLTHVVGQLDGEAHVIELALLHKVLGIVVPLVIVAYAHLLGKLASALRGLLLQLVGKGQAGVAHEVVETPLREQLVDLLTVVPVIVVILAATHDTRVNDVVGVDTQRVELHGHHDLQAQGSPLHAAPSLEALLALRELIEGELVLANAHHLALEVGSRLVGWGGVFDGDLRRALEELLADAVAQGKVAHIERVVDECHRLHVERLGLDTQQQVVTDAHIAIDLLPRDAVLQLLGGVAIYGFLLEVFLITQRWVATKQLHIVAEAHAVLPRTASAHKPHALPLHEDVVADKHLARTSVFAESRRENLRVAEVVKRVSERTFLFLESELQHQAVLRLVVGFGLLLFGRCGWRGNIVGLQPEHHEVALALIGHEREVHVVGGNLRALLGRYASRIGATLVHHAYHVLRNDGRCRRQVVFLIEHMGLVGPGVLGILVGSHLHHLKVVVEVYGPRASQHRLGPCEHGVDGVEFGHPLQRLERSAHGTHGRHKLRRVDLIAHRELA